MPPMGTLHLFLFRSRFLPCAFSTNGRYYSPPRFQRLPFVILAQNISSTSFRLIFLIVSQLTSFVNDISYICKIPQIMNPVIGQISQFFTGFCVRKRISHKKRQPTIHNGDCLFIIFLRYIDAIGAITSSSYRPCAHFPPVCRNGLLPDHSD